MSAATTVRELLEERLGDVAGTGFDPKALADGLVRDLAALLSTGPGWVTREIDARQLEAGDVMAAKDGRLWAVTALAETDDGEVSPEIVRGDAIRTPSFHPRRKVAILLTRDDARALAVLAEQLGAEVAERVVA